MQRQHPRSRGFSLVEMVVVIGIFAFLSTIVFTNYSEFNVKASLDNLAHRVALVVREAQVYGLSVSQSQPQQFKGFGVYFSSDAEANAAFILFSDLNSDKRYSSSYDTSCDGTDECYEKVFIRTGDIVDRIQAVNQSGQAPFLSEAHIVFTRPNPDANIFGFDLNGVPYDNLAKVDIYLKSPREAEKKVVVWSTGQITVE